MNSPQKKDIVVGVMYGLLAVATGIAVILGATHQLWIFAICLIIIALCIIDYKQESSK